MTRPAATCRSCGARIVWCDTPAQQRMPVDAQPTVDGNVRILDAHRGPIAYVLAGDDLARATALAEILHTSHFATCPQADQWRKARGEQGTLL